MRRKLLNTFIQVNKTFMESQQKQTKLTRYFSISTQPTDMSVPAVAMFIYLNHTYCDVITRAGMPVWAEVKPDRY